MVTSNSEVMARGVRMIFRLSKTIWRKRVGVEPTGDTARCHPPVLKTTGDVLIRYENFLLYMILQPLTKTVF
jgi:hypothetical protein